MNVRNRRLDAVVGPVARSGIGRLAATLGLVAVGLVFVTGGAAVAAGFTAAPERLYMLPENPLTPLPAEIAALAVPVEVLKFDGSTDLISQDVRTITVDTVNGDAGCDLTQPPYDIDDCSRIQLSGVSHGRLHMGAITTIADGGGPGITVYKLPSGARIDQPYQVAAGSFSLGINGTPDELNDALGDLVYTPDDGYHYTGGPGETLNIVVVPGNSDDVDPPDSTATDSIDIQIRVLDVNDFPSHDGPTAKAADAQIELVIQNEFAVADEDNDEIVDNDAPPPPCPAGDPGGVLGPCLDPVDGDDQDMLLIGWLDCGQPIDPGTGFHFGSSIFQSDDLTIDDLLIDLFPLADNPDYQLVVDAFLDGLDLIAPELKDLVWATSSPLDYTTAFAGVASIDEIQNALDNVYFTHNAPNDTCTLVTVVTDLGNNGLPLQYVGTPFPDLAASEPFGIEIPFFGFDFNVLEITTGDLEEVDVSFDVAPLLVDEGAGPVEALAELHITPAIHPEFTIEWDAVPRSTDPDPIPVGVATPGDDFAGTFNNTLTIPENEATIPISGQPLPFPVATNVFGDALDEGNETFKFELDVVTNAPPLGWAITSATPTRDVVIIDDDDPVRTLTSVSDSTVTEGDSGTQNLTFTLGLDGPADGNEQVQVDTSSVAPSVAGVDYTAIVGQTVTFAYGATTATVNVVVHGDTAIEGDETVTLAVSNPVDVTLGGDTSGNGTITNDDVAPTVTINQGAIQADPTNGASIVFDVAFDKVVTGFDDGATDVVLSGTAGGPLNASISGSGGTYTVTVTGMTSSGTVIADVPAGAAKDADMRDNVASTSTDHQVTYDNDRPTVTINQAVGQADPTSSSPILFTAVFSEPVTGFVDGEVALTGTASATTALVSGSGATYTVTVSAMTGDGTVIADILANRATDAAGNQNMASTSNDHTVTFDFPDGDVTPPSVTIDQGATQLDPTNVASIVFDVVFTESVNGFGDSAGDVTLSGTAGGTLSAAVSGSGTTYAVTVTGMTSSGTVIAAVPAGAAEDAALHDNVLSTSVDNMVTYDVTGPTVSINQAVGQADPTSSSPILFTAVFSEPVTGFVDGEVALTGTASATTALVSGSGATYTITVSAMTGAGTVIADVPAGVAADLAGNLNVASTSTDNMVTFEVVAGDPNDSSSSSSSSSTTSTTSTTPTTPTTPTTAPGTTSATVPNPLATGGGATPDPFAGNAAPGPTLDPSGYLPATGSNANDLLVPAAAAVICGAVLLVVRRRNATS